MNFENHPSSWIVVKIKDITLPFLTTNPKEKPSQEFIYLDISSIDNTQLKITNPQRILGKNAPSRARRIVKSGDILFSTVRTYLKNIALVPDKYDNQLTSTGIAILRASNFIDNRYLFFVVTSDLFINSINQKMDGSLYPAIKDKDLNQAKIPLPPLNEQKRIVAKIEELFSELDDGIASLKKAQAQLKIYRQALLKQAFEGKLTEQWRKENADKLESADELLARIKQERETRYQQQLDDWKSAIKQWESQGKSGTKPTKPRAFDKLNTLTNRELSNLRQIPSEWCWARIDQLGDVQLGRQRAPKHHTGEHMRPYLRVANVFEDRIDTTDVLSMNFTPEEYQTYKLEYGDILLNEGQSLEWVGRSAIYKNEIEDVCFQNTLVRFRPSKLIGSQFPQKVFIHYLYSGRFQKIAKWTTNIAHLGASRFCELEFPFPPLQEQQKIIEEIERIETHCLYLEESIKAGLKKAEILRQSILKKAFLGQLVPQDPNDEPASILLERIKQEQSLTKK